MAEETKETKEPYVHPFDMKPVITDLTKPLTVDLFLKDPIDVLNTQLYEIIGNKFLSKKGTTERERETTTAREEVTAEYFEGCKYIGLLFSADWCAPCHTMMPLLRNFYTDINLDERQFEIILVSNDSDEKGFDKHYGGMPWTSLPYGDPRIKEWMRRYNVLGVPQLIILEARTGFKVTDSARKDLALAQNEEPGVKGSWK